MTTTDRHRVAVPGLPAIGPNGREVRTFITSWDLGFPASAWDPTDLESFTARVRDELGLD
jgi:hypothetical protein